MQYQYNLTIYSLSLLPPTEHRQPNTKCCTAHVHIPVHTPVALAPPMQQLNALHRHVTSTHPVVSLMTHTGDDID